MIWQELLGYAQSLLVIILPCSDHLCTCLQVTDLYRQKIPDGAVVLDLMSSWVSHFPEEAQYGRVIGHGMNAKEVTSS